MSIENNTSDKAIRKVALKLREYNADELIQYQAEKREEALHEEASKIASALAEGRAEGRENYKSELIQKFKGLGMNEAEISRLLS